MPIRITETKDQDLCEIRKTYKKPELKTAGELSGFGPDVGSETEEAVAGYSGEGFVIESF